jgi:hypothetical protein
MNKVILAATLAISTLLFSGCSGSSAAPVNKKDYVIQSHAPSITIHGQSYQIGSFADVTPVNTLYIVAIMTPSAGGWLQFVTVKQYDSGGALYSDVQAQGGIQAYIALIQGKINDGFAAQSLTATFTMPNYVATQPVTDDASALAAVTAYVNAGSFANASAGNSPIPPQMSLDYSANFSLISTKSIGYSFAWCGGQFTKMGDSLLLYSDPSGSSAWLSPATDLAKFATANQYANACYAKQYGFSG